MLTNSELKSEVDDIWNRLWSAGGIADGLH